MTNYRIYLAKLCCIPVSRRCAIRAKDPLSLRASHRAHSSNFMVEVTNEKFERLFGETRGKMPLDRHRESAQTFSEGGVGVRQVEIHTQHGRKIRGTCTKGFPVLYYHTLVTVVAHRRWKRSMKICQSTYKIKSKRV